MHLKRIGTDPSLQVRRQEALPEVLQADFDIFFFARKT